MNYLAVAPSGSLTSGTPPAGNLAAGQYDFTVTALFKGALPTVNSATFNQRLAAALSALVPGASVARGFSVSVGDPQAIARPGTSPSWGYVTAASVLLALAAAPAALGATVGELAAYLDGRGSSPGWWATISGGAIAVTTPATQAKLRQAFARAFWQSTTWTAMTGVTAPSDGAPMQNALDRADACSGGTNLSAFVVRACMRFQPAATQSTTAAITAPPFPVLCTVTSRERFWLRPTPIFDREGPEFPAGTTVHILASASGTQGSLSLYWARVGTQEGFVAMNAQEVATCGNALRPSAQSPARPGTPAPGATPPPPSTNRPPADSAAVTFAKYAGLGVLAAGTVGGVVLLATSKPASKPASKATSKPERTQKGRTR